MADCILLPIIGFIYSINKADHSLHLISYGTKSNIKAILAYDI